MHVPNPLGRYTLVLRDKDAKSPRNYELMFDYNSNDLYFIKDNASQKMAKSIFDKIVRSKLENTFINIYTNDETDPSTIIPEPVNRKINNWYMNIQSASEQTE